MLVRVQNEGHVITGIRMRTSDARRHFPAHVKSVDLELDHVRIRCELKPSFRLNQPQISDPRLQLWLESKVLWSNLSQVLEMQKDGSAYRLAFTTKPRRQTARPPVLIASARPDEG